ncbi:MAG: hypothetical protein M1837_002876 [Sclerophora amabilis]|nr:MAG: hypothetical protein M1837_002876 [Sclerophora amabilis]
MAARLLPWMNSEKENRVTDALRFRGSKPASSSSTALHVEPGHTRTRSNSSNSAFLSPPLVSPPNNVSTNSTAPQSSITFRHSRMNSATQMALASNCVTAVNGLISKSPTSQALPPTTTPAARSRSSTSAEPKPLPASPVSTEPSPVVELPGSLLMENKGFPLAHDGNTSRSRRTRGPEKLSPSAMQTMGFEAPRKPSVVGSDVSDLESGLSPTGTSSLSEPPGSPSRERVRSHGARRSIDSYHAATGRRRSEESSKTQAAQQISSNSSPPRRLEYHGTGDSNNTTGSLTIQPNQTASKEEQDISIRDGQQPPIDKVGEEKTEANPTHAEPAPRKATPSSSKDLPQLPEMSNASGPDLSGAVEKFVQSRNESCLSKVELSRKSSTVVPPDVKSDPQFVELEKKLQDAERLTTDLKQQIETFKVHQEQRTQRLKEIKECAKDYKDHVRALKRENKALCLTVDLKNTQVKDLETEVYCRTDDVNQIEETLQRFINVQRQMEDKESRRNAIEKENAALKNEMSDQADLIVKLQGSQTELQQQISAKDGTLKKMRSEMTKLAERLAAVDRTAASTLAPSSPDSIGGASYISSAPSLTPTTMTSPSLSMGDQCTPLTDPHAPRGSDAEARIRHMKEDIRLYKLDVRGYKKDVRARDRKIVSLEANLRELQEQFDARVAESGASIQEEGKANPAKADEADDRAVGLGISTSALPPSDNGHATGPRLTKDDESSLVSPVSPVGTATPTPLDVEQPRLLSQGHSSMSQSNNLIKTPVSRFSTGVSV